MEKQQVLDRLMATIEKLYGLKPEQFSYEEFVKKFDKKGCGTVCCVAGWYPKWFPEAGLKWDNSPFKQLENKNGTVQKALCLYHGLSEEIIDMLFYGFGNEEINIEEIAFSDKKALQDVSLSDVKLRFQTVYEAIDKDLIDYN